MENENTQATLRETIAEQFDALETADAATTPTAAPELTAEGSAIRANEPSGAQAAGDDKPGRTAGRLRDEQGRLLPGKAERPSELPSQVADAAKPSVVATPPTVTPAAEPLVMPKSWAPTMAEHWQKMPPEVAKYINQREVEMSRGIAPMRQEIESARPVMQALAPHMELLQHHNIEPGQLVSNLTNAHRMLATGSPEQKLGMFVKLAQDYKIPLEQILVRGNDGQVYLNTQLPAPPQAQPQAPDIDGLLERKLTERDAQHAARQFVEAKDASGNPLHPHFETVRETMSQLLAAGISQDLPSAYDAALRLPQHSALYEQQQQQRSAQDEAEKARKLAEAAGVARRNAVSPRSSSPTAKAGSGTAKGIRGALEEAWDSAMPGRV